MSNRNRRLGGRGNRNNALFLMALAVGSLVDLVCGTQFQVQRPGGVRYQEPEPDVPRPRKEHPLAHMGRLAYDMDAAAADDPPSIAAMTTTTPLLETFQVAQPVLLPSGPAAAAGPDEAVTVTLMDHQFANSYGDPFVGTYAPPRGLDFDHVVVNFTVEVRGRQFDRWGSAYLGDVNFFSTSTAEPTPRGITWTWIKDVTPYLSLWREPQTLLFQLDNVVNDVYTGLLNATLTATFFRSPVQTGGQPPADLILPVSRAKAAAVGFPVFRRAASAGYWTYPEEDATALLHFPRNVNRAVFSSSVKAQGEEEFWWSNAPQSAADAFEPDVGTYPGYSPFREVQVLIDGRLAGVRWPFPVAYTGGVVPQLHRPVVGIDAFDLRDHEIDITPWLPLLCDGADHTIGLRVVGLVDDGHASARLSDTTGSSWYLVGKVFLWLDDDEGSVTTGVVGGDDDDPKIEFSQTLTRNATGFNESLEYNVAVTRHFSITSQVTTQKGSGTASWSQRLSYSNAGGLYAHGHGAVNTPSTTGEETSGSPGWRGYKTTFSYPLHCNTTTFLLPQGNLTLWARLDQGLRLHVQGNTVYPTGLEAFQREGGAGWAGSVVDTDRNGTANYSRYADNSVTSGAGRTHQVFRLSGLDGNGTYETPGTELYSRDVTAYNNSVVADKEVVADKAA
ncbi:Peptide-N4-(N-acetyl-beta-glucosaminyl)asparagine amidase A [Colletotrichum shisoi]|uniref:Peptide-N4-(N-acetyl-beta-glucosaminyl)asparagine amidase A n=1 Tax=Colletotrichum shisoi TaxID=2078593 RepID=A0A5Q4BBY5_9PEZI|nr:Peptide-N4-(N-acetyl-beta-glucosaminyl)asparagine amidase A [Colletotrichum shisoi]